MTTAPVKTETTQPEPKQKRDVIDVVKAFKMRYLQGNTLQQIGDHFGCDKSAVHQKLATFEKMLKNAGMIEAYEQNRAKILSVAEMEMVSDILDSEKREKATLGNAAYAFTQIHNARRLEEDLSTANVNHQSLIIEASRLKKEREALEAELENL